MAPSSIRLRSMLACFALMRLRLYHGVFSAIIGLFCIMHISDCLKKKNAEDQGVAECGLVLLHSIWDAL